MPGPEYFAETQYISSAVRQIKSSIFWQVERIFQRCAFVWRSPYIALAGIELLNGIQGFADILGYYELIFCGFNRPPAKTIEWFYIVTQRYGQNQLGTAGERPKMSHPYFWAKIEHKGAELADDPTQGPGPGRNAEKNRIVEIIKREFAGLSLL